MDCENRQDSNEASAGGAPVRDSQGRSRLGASITPQFAVAAVILLVSALSFQVIVNRFELFFSKLELPLQKPLYRMADNFGHYVLENEDPPLTPEIEAVLGAHAYITREYRDTRKKKGDPGALLRLHIAYFTGTPDPVIHVPDVCYIAHGAQGLQKDLETVRLQSDLFVEQPDGTVSATTADGSQVTLPRTKISLLAFDFVGDDIGQANTVTYFFAANGEFMGTTGDVRKLVIDITDRYAYWAKIEVLPIGLSDREQALSAVADFLSAALPEVMLCLPDWKEVKAGRFPPEGEDVSEEFLSHGT
jgi:hypothetical protein